MNIICKCKQPFVSSTLSVTRHLVVPSIINTTTNLLHFENHYVKQNNIKNHVIKLTNKICLQIEQYRQRKIIMLIIHY